MIIKEYRCGRFAGLKDKSLEFTDGLNVLLGNNESGKSTLIEGIHAAMFKATKQDRRSVADKTFYAKFMPLPDGDSIDSRLVLACAEGEYTISREWGANPSAELLTPKAEKFVSEEKVKQVLDEVLMFGEGTYSNIFFSKQTHFREALERITKSPETTSEISTLLRKAIMELDGVSVDELGAKIDEEIDRLLKRWDVERDCPENNRGINNPYKTGIGEVLAYYYEKENLLRDMEEAKSKQMQYEQISSQLKDLEEQIASLQQQKEQMEQIEEDVLKRSQLELKIDQYNKDLGRLMEINQQWPKHELELEHLKKELTELEQENEKLEQEKAQAAKVLEKEALQKKVDKINELRQLMQQKTEEAKSITITKEDISALEKYQQEMRTAEAKMQARVMIGKLISYTGKTDLTVTRDLEEPEIIKPGDTFKANGFIRLESDHLSLELKSGDMDFAELRNQYENNKENLEALLQKLGVNNIEAAKLKKEELNGIHNDIVSLEKQITGLLDGAEYEELAAQLSSYGDLGHVRDLATIESAMKELNDKKVGLLVKRESLETNIAKWQSEYGDVNGLLEQIIEVKMANKEVEAEIEKLAPLPSEFENTDMYRAKLVGLRKSYEENRDALQALNREYLDIENSLPELSYEDMKEAYQQAEETFIHKLEQGKKLLKIKAAFEATRAQIDDSSFKPVADAFSRYVVTLTDGNFASGDISNDFELKLEKDDNTNIPVELLSTGTYDAVALALRLAVAEYIFGDRKGFIILDDCLVDLDPDRKQAAVNLIKKFAEKHQVIFTTCSPETADLLGGTIIHMS
jgi:exonuclease SbcC